VYVERYFPAANKAMMEDLVENLREGLRQRIAGLEWMSEDTKDYAFEKLQAFTPNIGYPSEWEDFSSVQIRADDLMGNVRAMREWQRADALERLTRPTDPAEWFMSPQTVNAYYVAQFNSITFPAGILEPPFFDPAADPAVNYGAIGAVIGHEMGHGFDDQGSKSDAEGVQRNWWSDEDRARFDARTAQLAAQYDAYEAVPGTFVDGEFTLGENIGDLGGLNVAYHAYRLSLNGKEPPVIDGLTGDQRFFLAFAQVWRGITREETLVARLKSDPHSPNRFRANGTVRNMDAWYEAFDVQPDDALYLPPDQRVSIW
jgi:predicted metalloendopeptidase